MPDSIVLYVDYNDDIRQVVSLIDYLARYKNNINKIDDAWLPRYYFEDVNQEITVYVDENLDAYGYDSPTASYRFRVTIEGHGGLAYARELYEMLDQLFQLPVALEIIEPREMRNNKPVNYVPNYDTITRSMPAELLLESHISTQRMLLELTKQCQLTVWDKPVILPKDSVIYHFSSVYDIIKNVKPFSRYYRLPATHRILVFGINDNPDERRENRDNFAHNLYEKLIEINSVNTQLFEVLAGTFAPFRNNIHFSKRHHK